MNTSEAAASADTERIEEEEEEEEEEEIQGMKRRTRCWTLSQLYNPRARACVLPSCLNKRGQRFRDWGCSPRNLCPSLYWTAGYRTNINTLTDPSRCCVFN